MLSVTMQVLLLASASAEEAPAPEPAVAEAPAKKSWFKQIRYAVGLSTQAGGGTDGTVFGENVAVEPAAFELRSFLWPRFAFHTTLNLSRMIVAGARDLDGRLDYDCHLGGHVPLSPTLTFVVAPGAAIAYSFGGSGYQRFLGDVRLGLDIERGAWTTGFYVRPYAGWYTPVGGEGRAVGGALFEMVNVYNVPKKGQRVAD